MVLISGSTIDVPGRALETRPSRYADAWLNDSYLTVELYQDVLALRVAYLRGGLLGDWFHLGAWHGSEAEFVEQHSLPRDFRYQAICTLRPGTLLNIGRCSPQWFVVGLPEAPHAVLNVGPHNRGVRRYGGADQAEFLEGPLPLVRPL
jgi:hypothetical protein